MKEELEYKLNTLKQKTYSTLENAPLYKYKGVVSKLLGLTVEVKLPGLKIGELCYIQTHTGERKAAEVQAFKGDVAQLLLLYDGEGIGQGSLVETTGAPILFPVGDFLLGRLVNPLGEPMDSRPMDISGAKYMNINGTIPDAFHRPIITEQMSTGVRVIDGLLTMGTGQRMGLFAGSGVGKSTLLGMIARNSDRDTWKIENWDEYIKTQDFNKPEGIENLFVFENSDDVSFKQSLKDAVDYLENL